MVTAKVPIVMTRRFGRCQTVLLAAPGAGTNRMTEAANLVEVAALVGDTARAMVLAGLMGGERR